MISFLLTSSRDRNLTLGQKYCSCIALLLTSAPACDVSHRIITKTDTRQQVHIWFSALLPPYLSCDYLRLCALELEKKKGCKFLLKITFPFGGIIVSPPRLDRGTFLTNEPSRVEKQKLHLFETIVRLMGRNRKHETNWARCNSNFELRRKILAFLRVHTILVVVTMKRVPNIVAEWFFFLLHAGYCVTLFCQSLEKLPHSLYPSRMLLCGSCKEH